MRRLSFLALSLLLLTLVVSRAEAQPPEEAEATLREAKLDTTTAGLMEFFRKRVLPEQDHQRIKALILKLGAESFAQREEATAALIVQGPGIAALLRDAAGNEDPEIASRSRECLAIVEKTSTVPIVSAAVRLLAHRKPPEATAILLDFAPFAGGEEVLDTLREVLPSLAQRDGKPDAALEKALSDKDGLRIGLSAEALVRSKMMNEAAARKFLTHENALVRMRVALALAELNDRTAVPVLIDCLPTVTLRQAWQAEDVLCRLAGDKAPQAPLGEDESARKSAREAWTRWWKAEGDKIDLAQLKERPAFLGLTLIAYQDHQGQGQLMELGRDGKERWKFGGLQYPVDLQVLGNGRFLVAEMNGARITERNQKGEIVWQKQVSQPVACQRLPGGNTFVASVQGIYEYDAAGKQTFSHQRNRSDIMGARKHRNGEYILLTRTEVVRVDRKGVEVGKFSVGRTYNWSSFEVLPNGNLLIPLNRTNKVAEYTLDGKEVWSANIPFPTSAQRLPNGNVIAASMNYQRVTEVDRTGKQLNQIQVQGTPWCALKR